jgi:hypothetical protein
MHPAVNALSSSVLPKLMRKVFHIYNFIPRGIILNGKKYSDIYIFSLVFSERFILGFP